MSKICTMLYNDFDMHTDLEVGHGGALKGLISENGEDESSRNVAGTLG